MIDLERYRAFISDWPAFLEAAERAEPTVFRVRTGRIAPDEVADRLREQGFSIRALDGLPGFYRVESAPHPLSLTIEHWLGLLYIQQASTGVAVPALGASAGQRVLDLCASPGGKTTHLAEAMSDRGCLVANDISESRMRGLLGNVYRLAYSGVMTVAGDGREFPGGALFDRVLVDAPCSGEGTLRRRGGALPDQSRSFLGFVTRAQRALLERAVRLTRPGGVVLYVTCTFGPEENEAVVSDALERLPIELVPLDLPVPHAPGLTSFAEDRYDARLEGAARIYPHHLDSGGLFLAKLRRLDNGDSPRDDWSAVPTTFPGEGAADLQRLRRGIDEVRERFGIERDLSRVNWIMRGGRAWLHTLDEWPLASWKEGRWRALTVGLRAIEFDSRGRARPTNDFLRWAGADSAMLGLSRAELLALLAREPVSTSIDRLGPIALGYEGDVIGRGAVTRHGLASEIPKARASDLRRVLEQEPAISR